MKILAKSKGMTKNELYKLMSPGAYTKMGDKVGETLKIKRFAMHQEIDNYGSPKNVLAIETENGEIVVSASRTLTAEFEKLVTIFGSDGVTEIAIIESETGAGNDVLSCRFTGLMV